MRDNLPSKIKHKECGIVNLDSNKNDGTHWTGYVKFGKKITYFDSIGNLQPPKELVKYFNSDGSNNLILYNYERFQNLSEYTCGHLTLHFLSEFML